ncbi:MAG: zincin-like metallopeptidase domain-containing protein [Candidatus Sedimenticola endophacoides]
MKKTKRDFYQEVTDKLIARMEAGANPVRPRWDGMGELSLPVNQSTGDHYNGLNILLLWISQEEAGFSSSHWMTYKQAKAKGGQVRKGETGTTIIFYKTLEKETDQVDENGDAIKANVPMLRTFTVFNLDQIDGIERPEAVELGGGFETHQVAEQILEASGVDITEAGTRAFYRPATDQVYMPERERFSQAEDFYATALHELTHATKAKHRCNRTPYESDIKGASYAFEELVAEISAAFLMSNLSLPGIVQDHADYLSNWLEVLRNDKKAIFRAAAQAQKAHDWIMQAHTTALQKAG